MTNIFRTIAGISLLAGLPALAANYTIESRSSDLPAYMDVNDNVARGGRPTQNGINQLAKESFRTVINIDNDGAAIKRERKWVEDKGMTYVSIPMDWDSPVSDKDVDKILRLLTDSDNFPVFIHCKHGEDRTGMVMGVYRVLIEKWTPKAAYKEMRDLGFHTFFTELDDYFKWKTGF